MSESADDSPAAKPGVEPNDEAVNEPVDAPAVPATSPSEAETPAGGVPAETTPVDGASDAKEEEEEEEEEELDESGEPLTEAERIKRKSARVHAEKTKNKTAALQQDEKLKQLLEFANEIQSVQHFTYWKDHFLATYSEYLDPDGTATAREADDELYFWMQKLALTTVETQALCESGAISGRDATVTGQKSISEMTSQMAQCETQIKVYFPTTMQEEQQVGYSKFELAAVLIRDGFRVFEMMTSTRRVLIELRDGLLKTILKPNSLHVMDHYFASIDIFCDTMTDLGLYKLMQKCVELFRIRPRKKKKKRYNRAEHDPLSDTEYSGDDIGGRMFHQSKKNSRSIMDNGWVNGLDGEQVYDPDAAAEGQQAFAKPVRLRPPKKEEEEEEEDKEVIYYFDPTTGNIGKVSRRKCLQEMVIIRKDETGEEKQDGAVEEWNEKEKLIWDMKDACKAKKVPVKA